MGYKHGYNTKGDYKYFEVTEEMPLLEYLLATVGESRSKVKATLQGRGIKVNGKCVTQFDFLLKPGMKVAVSQTKRNQAAFKSRYVKIVYEDRWIEECRNIVYGCRSLDAECEKRARRLFS